MMREGRLEKWVGRVGKEEEDDGNVGEVLLNFLIKPCRDSFQFVNLSGKQCIAEQSRIPSVCLESLFLHPQCSFDPF